MKRVALLTLCGALLMSACGARPADVKPPVYDTGVDANSWARVPAGEFLMGIHDARVTIARDYEIMVTLVTNAQYAI
jgi:formylglycine-generating enzyme required for sulfatase activity